MLALMLALTPAFVLALALAMGSHAALAAPPQLAPLTTTPAGVNAAWQVAGLPGPGLPATRFEAEVLDGQPVLRVAAAGSYGHLVHALHTPAEGLHLAWRWRMSEPNRAANLRTKAGDDAAIKVCALFDLPMSAVPFMERQILRLARSKTGQDLPAASVCYVWDAREAPDTAIDNPYSRRVRYLVLRGPESALGQWLAESRNLEADFLRLFGDEASAAPRLVGITVAADADNTQGRSLAHVASLQLLPHGQPGVKR